LSGQNLLDMQSFVAAGLGLSSDGRMVVLMNGPMYPSAPNRYGLAPLRLGAVIVLQPRFDPRGMLQLIDRHRVTHMHIVPTMMHRLLKLEPGVRRAYDMGSLVDVTHGAAPCPPEVKRGMIDWWGPVISEYYGSTETGLITRITASDARAKPGSVGKALPGVEIRIFSAQGKEVSQGAVGEVCLRSRFMPDFTYHGDPAKRHAMERNGFVTVGDVGHLDEEGYLFLSGRSSDMIVSGGVNIYPQEAENLLVTHPQVMDAAVFGIPDPEMGERVHAVVQPVDPGAGGPDLERELLGFCRQHLAHYKCPRAVDFDDELPRQPTGKLYKRLLRDRYWGTKDTRIV